MRDVIEQTWGWDEEWQRDDFSKRLAACDVSVIEVNSQPAGSLWVESRPGAIHIVELQLLPTVQGQGIGTGVVQGLMQRAASQGASLTLSVVPANAGAKRLYERLGFVVCGHEPPFIHMRYDAGPSAV
jgi:ribosomal protein S18 acetylase RimI-like enzyme